MPPRSDGPGSKTKKVLDLEYSYRVLLDCSRVPRWTKSLTSVPRSRSLNFFYVYRRVKTLKRKKYPNTEISWSIPRPPTHYYHLKDKRQLPTMRLRIRGLIYGQGIHNPAVSPHCTHGQPRLKFLSEGPDQASILGR